MENGVRPLAAAEFEQQAMASDQLGPEMDTALLGLVGEIGSLVSALKKKRRDTDGFLGYHDAVLEELGDVLWYVSAVARRGGSSLSEAFARAEARRALSRRSVNLHRQGTASVHPERGGKNCDHALDTMAVARKSLEFLDLSEF